MRVFGWKLLIIICFTACGVNVSERNNTGIRWQEQGEYGEALKAFQAAQVSSPDLAEPYFNAASVLAEMGNLREARIALEQALKTADDNLSALTYYNLGNIYFTMEFYQDAVHAYQQSLLLNPTDHDARYNLELASKKLMAISTPAASQTEIARTPTSQSENGIFLTPTPPEQVLSTPQPSQVRESDLIEPLSIEEAGQLLDAIQQEQETLNITQEVMPDNPSEADW